MHSRVLLFCLLIASVPLFAQSSAPAPEGVPKNPRAAFAAAAGYYNFTDPALKPWHLKVTYQLYDDAGKPGEKGTYEYWWVSANLHRSTWTRPGATYTDWYTTNGKHYYLETGERLGFFEYKLQSALLAPLPDADELNPSKVTLSREEVPIFGTKLPCVMVVPIMPQHGEVKPEPMGLFPTYCFARNLPALRTSYSFSTFSISYDQFVKTQGRILPRAVQILEGKRVMLEARVGAINSISPYNPDLTPPTGALLTAPERVSIPASVAEGLLINKTNPVYPADARAAHVLGDVVLRAVIGRDGGVHELQVVTTPGASLAASTIRTVAHWVYQPYLLNGKPVEVETTIRVSFEADYPDDEIFSNGGSVN